MSILKDKFDLEGVERLKRKSVNEIVPLIPGLLEWLQDFNWPVARPIAEFLLGFESELVKPLKQVLCGSDDIWKIWVLRELIGKGSKELRISLEKEISRILTDPTDQEIREGVLDEAEAISFE